MQSAIAIVRSAHIAHWRTFHGVDANFARRADGINRHHSVACRRREFASGDGDSLDSNTHPWTLVDMRHISQWRLRRNEGEDGRNASLESKGQGPWAMVCCYLVGGTIVHLCTTDYGFGFGFGYASLPSRHFVHCSPHVVSDRQTQCRIVHIVANVRRTDTRPITFLPAIFLSKSQNPNPKSKSSEP